MATTPRTRQPRDQVIANGRATVHVGVTKDRKTSKMCGAKLRRKGRYCALPAGFQTDHEGIGTCYRHMGNSKSSKKGAGMEIAIQAINNPKNSATDMVEIEPHNGLLVAVRSAAGEFFYWQERVKAAERDAHSGDVEAHKFMMGCIKEMRECRMQMARLSKMSLDAGLAERQVALQERMAELMAAFARELLKGLPLTERQEQMVPAAVQNALLALESGEMYAHTPKPRVALRNYKKHEVDIIEHEPAR